MKHDCPFCDLLIAFAMETDLQQHVLNEHADNYAAAGGLYRSRSEKTVRCYCSAWFSQKPSVKNGSTAWQRHLEFHGGLVAHYLSLKLEGDA